MEGWTYCPAMRNEPLYPRGAIWWCRVRNPNGGRCLQLSTGCKDRKAAVIRWRELERESIQGTDQTKNQTSLADALDRRIAERRAAGRAEGTIDCLTKKARQLCRVLGAETLLSRLGAADVGDYVNTRIGEGAKRATIHKELSTLRGAIKLARHQAFDVRPPDEILPLEFEVKYKPRSRALSVAEIESLMGVLRPKRAAVVGFIVATSATYPSEVQNALRGDINQKTWMVHLRGTKRDTRDRSVPVPMFARGWLQFALDHAEGVDDKMFAPWTNVRRDLHSAALRLSTCAKCLSKGKVAPAADCKRCLEMVPFEKLSPNDLRRTYGRQLRARGVEPQLIAVGMGHTDSRMVERVYGRITPEELSVLLTERLAVHPLHTAPRKGRAQRKQREASKR